MPTPVNAQQIPALLNSECLICTEDLTPESHVYVHSTENSAAIELGRLHPTHVECLKAWDAVRKDGMKCPLCAKPYLEGLKSKLIETSKGGITGVALSLPMWVTLIGTSTLAKAIGSQLLGEKTFFVLPDAANTTLNGIIVSTAIGGAANLIGQTLLKRDLREFNLDNAQHGMNVAGSIVSQTTVSIGAMTALQNACTGNSHSLIEGGFLPQMRSSYPTFALLMGAYGMLAAAAPEQLKTFEHHSNHFFAKSNYTLAMAVNTLTTAAGLIGLGQFAASRL